MIPKDWLDEVFLDGSVTAATRANLLLHAAARGSPWRRQVGVAAEEEEHVVYLTNHAGDTLILTADDVAHIVNVYLAT